VGLSAKNAELVEAARTLDHPAGSHFAKPSSRFRDRLFLFGNDQKGISSRQGNVSGWNDIASTFAHHRHLHTARHALHDLIKLLAGDFLVDGNLAHVETLRLRRKFRLHYLRHEIDAQNWTNDPEWVADRGSDR